MILVVLGGIHNYFLCDRRGVWFYSADSDGRWALRSLFCA